MCRHGFIIAVAAAAAVTALPAGGQSLRGSPASVDLMYARARSAGLPFLETPRQVATAAAAGQLKLVSFTNDVALDRVFFPFVLPQTLDFINSLASEYHASCGERLMVTSGTRPTDEQPRNASPESVHPTGMAVDFRLPAGVCRIWLRDRLLTLERQGVIEATEERFPRHLHVAVFARPGGQYARGAKGRETTSSAGEVVPADTGRRKRTRSR